MEEAIGKTCPYCLFPIKPSEDVVFCPQCGIPHHKECWEENQGCTTFGCTAKLEAAVFRAPYQADTLSSVETTSQSETESPQAESDGDTTSFEPLCSKMQNVGDRISYKAVAVILVIIAIGIISAPQIGIYLEKEHIGEMGLSQDIEGLISYIDANADDPEKKEFVELAISELAGLNVPAGNGYLSEIICNEWDEEFQIMSARALVENKARIPSIKGIYELYKDNSNHELSPMLRDLIRFSDKEKLFSLIEGDINAQIQERDYDLTNFQEMVGTLLPEYESRVRDIIYLGFVDHLKEYAEDDATSSMRELLKAGERYQLFSYDLVEPVLDMIETYSGKYSEINGIDYSIQRFNSEIDDINSTVQDFNFEYLEGFIVAEIDMNTYEFAYPEYDYWLGRIPSTQHAILITSSISYTTKGWFSSNVRRLDRIPMQLKNEYGGFMQYWDIYEEVPDKEIQEYNEKTSQVLALIDEVNSLTVEKNKLSETNEKLSSEIRQYIFDNFTT